MLPGTYTRSRARTDTETLVQMYPELRARAFAVQGIEDFNQLKRIQESVARLTEGGDWKTLQKQIAAELGGSGQATRRHAETVLRTNGFQAYASARYRKQQNQKDVFPYLKYVTMDDGRVRDRHAELDGIILPADDPFWNDHYPPWDFNCRCIVIEMTAEDAQQAVAHGEGSMWNKTMRDDYIAANRGKDAARQFHFRPDSLDMDLRDLAKAEGRTPEDMKSFGQLMQTRRIGTGRLRADGREQTTSVREWLWQPLRREYRQKAAAAPDHERSWALDAWTGEELAHAEGTRHTAKVPQVPAAAANREVVVIHSHTTGSATLSPRDVLAATGRQIDAVESIIPEGDWQRVNAAVRSPHMRRMLSDWHTRFAAAKGDRAALRRLRVDWHTWLRKQHSLGYLDLTGGTLS